MPVIGLLALMRFFGRIFTHAWRNEAFRGLLLVTLSVICLGAWFYRRFEPTIETWLDAFYFTVITLTTIGYGDMSPTVPATKVFTMVYVFVGLGIIAGLIGLIGESVIADSAERTEQRRERKK